MGIQLLDQNTINKIAAGEVVERPSSVVKELVENAIDAKADSITVEIKEGGIGFIRVTDNGCGISREEVEIAFLRHSTSKIKTVTDLLSVSSLGFRGEALASIASVSQVELITKVPAALTGIRYTIEGGEKKGLDEVGAPNGTTFIVRNLFYNTPARRKFLKSATTEASYISNIIEHIALSHPEISFRLIINGSTKLQTYGNNNLREIIYNIYGKEIEQNLISIDAKNEFMHITGFIGKPVISRGNRNFLNYYINNRYIRSSVLNSAIEDAYSSFLMQHRYPFTVLHIEILPEIIDVNVHPAKMELRFSNSAEVKSFTYDTCFYALSKMNLITDVTFDDVATKQTISKPESSQVRPAEPFEINRYKIEKVSESKYTYPKENIEIDTSFTKSMVAEKNETYEKTESTVEAAIEKPEPKKSIAGIPKKVLDIPMPQKVESTLLEDVKPEDITPKENSSSNEIENKITVSKSTSHPTDNKPVQATLFEMDKTEVKQAEYKIIGQVFDTYWIIQYMDKMYIIDQHAAHEKVLYERFCKQFENSQSISQGILPPMVLSLGLREEEVLKNNLEIFNKMGFEIEHFGGKEYYVRAVPQNLYGLNYKDMLIEILDNLVNDKERNSTKSIYERIATLACKAAVKGNNRLSYQEADSLINELFTLDNPFNCPHGRPTIIAMTKYELEKKFKRII